MPFDIQTHSCLSNLKSFFSDSPTHGETYVFAIAGDDRLLHQFVNAYQRAYKLNPERSRRIEIKLLLLPWGQNHLASFISRHDPWYHRHIYTPFYSDTFVLPWIKLNDADDVLFSTNTSEISAPGKFFRESVENYAREASYVTNIILYELQAWINPVSSYDRGDPDEEVPDQVIAFCQRVEFGMKDQGDGVPKEVDLSFLKMDLCGVCTRKVEESCAFNRLLVANVQWNNDPWDFPPNPTMPWLELYVEVNAVVGTKSFLLTDSKHRIDSLTLTCKNPNDKFSAIVDGQTFGPFHHIKISRATCEKSKKKSTSISSVEENEDEKYIQNKAEERLRQLKKKSISLPIQTFFPLII